MIARYALLAGRIRQDVAELERVVERVERAARARHQDSANEDLLLDAVALNLHDFYTGLERIFTQIASTIDQTAPAGADWHRELLRQMTVEIPGLRPRVLSAEVTTSVDEFLRFRHVVRHLYAFELDPARVERLASRLPPTFLAVRAELIVFAMMLEDLAHDS